MARVLFKIPPLTYPLLVRELSWRAYYSRFPLLLMLSWYGDYHGARTIQDSLSYLCSFGTGIIMARVLFKIRTHGAYYSRFPLMVRVLFEILSLTYALLVGNYHGARTIRDSHSWRAYYSRFPLIRAYYSRFPLMARVLFEIPTHGARTIRDSHSWRAYYSRFPLLLPTHGARTIRDSLSYLCSLGRELSWRAYYSRFPLMARVLLKIPTHGTRTTQDSHSYLCSLGRELSWRAYYSRFPLMAHVLFEIHGALMARVLFEIPTHARVLFEIPTHGARTIRDSLSYLCSLGREL